MKTPNPVKLYARSLIKSDTQQGYICPTPAFGSSPINNCQGLRGGLFPVERLTGRRNIKVLGCPRTHSEMYLTLGGSNMMILILWASYQVTTSLYMVKRSANMATK